MRPVIVWLMTGCVLIFIMTAVGGITRLTDSGLSMVEWDLIMGSVPPLSEGEWEETFDKYKQYPEFKHLHSHFTLQDFKQIFFWEYFHRMIGRFIGVVFIIPFIFFWIKGYFDKKLLVKLFVLLAMGAFQGFLGWYMVKSGLIKEPKVSHYRLAAHLTTAFLTIAYTFWVALGIIYPENEKGSFPKLEKGMKVFFPLLLIQIVYGAFVAGRDAGKMHNFWPHMNPGEFISPSAFSMNPLHENFLDNSSGIQFLHRYLAYLVAGIVVYFWFKFRKADLSGLQKKGLNIMLWAVGVQFILGVLTLVFSVPLILGLLHQLGALVLLLATVFFLHRLVFAEQKLA